tara:strand:+ start:63 stop:419 length:357 start_codon:yes stop_codon:yes gene_type:complete
MKTKIFNSLLVAFSLFALISCKDEKKEEVSETPKVETTADSKTTAELNPEHGQPGHRCDIPVGTPLDQPANTQMQQNSTSVNPNVSPVRVNGTALTKNPAHGDPGHRCDIPVGADLNS